jgi:hypothetical protein
LNIYRDWVEDKFEGFGVLFNEYPTEFDQFFDFTDFDLVEELWTKYDGEFKDDNKVNQKLLIFKKEKFFIFKILFYYFLLIYFN